MPLCPELSDNTYDRDAKLETVIGFYPIGNLKIQAIFVPVEIQAARDHASYAKH